MRVNQHSASEVALSFESVSKVVDEVAEATLARLKPLGFPGASAKMLLADVNERLDSEGLPVLNLTRIKLVLSQLGYAPEEVAWVPMAGTKYSAWRKVPE